MRRVLFVDDEAKILSGLRRMLRGNRDVWDMTFVEGGETALEAMAKTPFDVIVSDMRMPGMDGAELLRRVQEDHPETVRIILSGHADLEASMRAARVAHQFLSKPCDSDRIREIVTRACDLQALLNGAELREVVGSIDSLPVLPRVYNQLVAAMADEEVSLDDVAEIVQQDVGITAKILQLVNSSFFGVARSIADIRQATSHLGMNMVRDLTLSMEVFRAFEESALPNGFSLDREHARSMLTARIAKKLLDDRRAAEDAFLAAALHDIGRLIVAAKLPHLYDSMIGEGDSQNGKSENDPVASEGISQAEIGAYLLGLWGMSYTIVEAVAHHHMPSRVEQRKFGVLGSVHVASGLAQELLCDASDLQEEAGAFLDMDYLKEMNLLEALPVWRELAANEARDEPGAAA